MGAPVPAGTGLADDAGPANVERYDFYEMLPKFGWSYRAGGSAAAWRRRRDRPAGAYVLQVALPQSRPTACVPSLRWGIESVQRVSVDNDWHRNRVGPISTSTN